MKRIYGFYWDCGRMGSVQSLFVADSEQVAKCIGKRVYFGEILGKHSEIYGRLKETDLTVKTEDPQFIAEFERIFGEDFSTGHNPLDYIEESEDEEDE